MRVAWVWCSFGLLAGTREEVGMSVASIVQSQVGVSPEEFLAAIQDRKGQFVRLGFSTTKKARRGDSAVLRTETVATVTTGKEYANLAMNEGKSTGSLPWGSWLVRPWVIVHTPKGATDPVHYGRIYIATKGGANMRKTFFVDDQQVSREEFDSHLAPSQRADYKGGRPTPEVLTLSPRLDHLTLL